LSDAVADLGRRIQSLGDLLQFRDRPVHVVGAGSVEGAHLLLFLLDHGFSRLVGHDFSEEQGFDRAFKRFHVGWPAEEREAMLRRLREGVVLRFRDHYLEGVELAEAIGVTQGWYLYDSNHRLADSPDLRERFFSLMQLYLALAPGIVVGVTGSQGKSTTTRLLRDMLIAGGREVIFAGNDRHSRQALAEVVAAGPDTVVLLEISNRHLKSLGRSPGVAVVTNVFPNHLEEHGGWEGYVAAKSEIVRYQSEGDIAVLNGDLTVTREMARLTPGRAVWFGERLEPAEPGVAVHLDRMTSQQLAAFDLPADSLALPGRHNLQNVAAAAAAALALEVAPGAIAEAAARFRGLKHRIQFIWESGGVRFYDDLNSTTPTASEAALQTLGNGVIWIFGGDDKGLDSEGLVGVAGDAVRVAIALPGPGSDRLVPDLLRSGVQVERLEDLPAAVARAVRVAQPGESVLLSPACPGFFTRYYVGADEDTGFRRLVREATLHQPPMREQTPVREQPSAQEGPATSPPARRPRKSEDPG
jgi:UDP-N-acetylmuramoylalanine--D-glutamate ligase